MSKLILSSTAALLAAITIAPAADVKENWNKHCLNCHGTDGRGQTKLGKKSEVKDFTDAKYQDSFSDGKALKSVKEGLKEGSKEKMKPFSDKLTDEEIKALVKHVRQFRR